MTQSRGRWGTLQIWYRSDTYEGRERRKDDLEEEPGTGAQLRENPSQADGKLQSKHCSLEETHISRNGSSVPLCSVI